jgi:hypothetical protein
MSATSHARTLTKRRSPDGVVERSVGKGVGAPRSVVEPGRTSVSALEAPRRDWRTARSSSTNAAIVGWRAPGERRSARNTIASRSGGTEVKRLGGVGSRFFTASSTCSRCSPVKGRRPVSISYSTTPSDQTSVRWSRAAPRACSGDM